MNMNEIKAALVPGVLAFVGVRAAGLFTTSQTGQVLGGVAGAMAGIILAKKL